MRCVDARTRSTNVDALAVWHEFFVAGLRLPDCTRRGLVPKGSRWILCAPLNFPEGLDTGAFLSEVHPSIIDVDRFLEVVGT